MRGFKYFLTIIDDHNRHVWVVMLKSKAKVSQKIKDFATMVETQFEKKIKMIRSDNGAELASNGIIHQISCVYTPQKNDRL